MGICLRDLPDQPPPGGGVDLPAAIATAARLGFGTIQLPSVRLVSPTLDKGELSEIGALAIASGITLTAALPSAHPDRVERSWGLDRHAPQHPFAQIDAGDSLGIASFHVVVGVDEDRFRETPSWADQLDRTSGVLTSLVSWASCPIVLKTHEEMTTFEAIRLCDRVSGLWLGFSPVNVVARLEDPLSAARRSSPFVHTVFVDDCALARTSEGLSRLMRPIGAGALPWPSMFDALPASADVTIDLHRAELSMPLTDPLWLSHQPELTDDELASLYAMSVAEGSPSSPVEERRAIALQLAVVPG
ncbi:TIM barrel protein [Microbacter sp. GSS18]|nr:TIM barrel protein [Microbacter sp. GSS18]